MKCPNCSHNNRDGAAFCKRCGQLLVASCRQCNAPLRAGAQFCQRCGATAQQVAVGQMTCGVCGEQNRPNAKFCRQCRTSLQGVTCPHCHAVNRHGATFCNICGKSVAVNTATLIACLQCGGTVRDTATFCQHCGKSPTSINTTGGRSQYETGKLPARTEISDGKGEQYLIIGLIAQGGMGAVYRAVRRSDKSLWAVKEMSAASVAADELAQTIDMFRQESDLLESLDHPNLPEVLGYFEQEGRHYMVMEYIDGETLEELWNRKGQLVTEDEAIEWGSQICYVLDYLHNQPKPIIYRDLKPANVMVETDTGQVKLIDFGIARRYKGGKKSDTVHLGTSGYAPIEQYGKQESTPTADIYALGVTLHQLLTGIDPSLKPFHFDPIKDHNSTVSTAVNNCITKAVYSASDKRHQSAAEMYKALTGNAIPTQPGAVVVTLPDEVDFGKLKVGRTARKKLTVGQAGEIKTSDKWLSAEIVTDDTDGSMELVISADTKKLRLPPDETIGSYPILAFPLWPVLWLLYLHARKFVPREQALRGKVEVETEKVTVLMTAVPTDEKISTGWGISLLLVTAELAGLIYLYSLSA